MLAILDDRSKKHFEAVKTFAEKVGKTENLKKQLDYLDTYSDHENDGRTVCRLFPDFGVFGESERAEPNFNFLLFVRRKDKRGVKPGETVTEDVLDTDYERWFNGGLLFHGRHDGYGSGSAPTCAVTLTPTDGWSIHT